MEQPYPEITDDKIQAFFFPQERAALLTGLEEFDRQNFRFELLDRYYTLHPEFNVEHYEKTLQAIAGDDEDNHVGTMLDTYWRCFMSTALTEEETKTEKLMLAIEARQLYGEEATPILEMLDICKPSSIPVSGLDYDKLRKTCKVLHGYDPERFYESQVFEDHFIQKLLPSVAQELEEKIGPYDNSVHGLAAQVISIGTRRAAYILEYQRTSHVPLNIKEERFRAMEQSGRLRMLTVTSRFPRHAAAIESAIEMSSARALFELESYLESKGL